MAISISFNRGAGTRSRIFFAARACFVLTAFAREHFRLAGPGTSSLEVLFIVVAIAAPISALLRRKTV